MTHARRFGFLVTVLTLAGTPPALSQVSTGSIAGIVEDTSGAVLPGVTVSLSGERQIGGTQTQVTDASGAYRFDRLMPGDSIVKFELQGFKTVERRDIVAATGGPTSSRWRGTRTAAGRSTTT
jgi:hypothetical protein